MIFDLINNRWIKQQINSLLLDNEMAKEAFSFEQLLEILSNALNVVI